MAYIFSKIQDALGNEQQTKADIFAPPQQQGGEQPPQQGALQPKTSTEGALGGATGDGAGNEGKPSDVTPGVDSRVVKQNLGKTKIPKFAETAQTQLSDADKSLQDEANSYVQNANDAATKNYTVDNDTAEKAIGGDQDAYGKVNSVLNTKAAAPVERFAPKTDTQIEDLENFKTNEGVKNLLRRESGPQYNAGEAAFDSMLLGRNSNFQQIKSLLGQKQDELTSRTTDYQTSKTDEAQKASEAALAKGQTGVRGYLGGQARTLQESQAAEMAAENAELAKMRSGGPGAESQAALEALRAKYAGSSPVGASKYLGQGVDASKFYNVRDDYSNSRDFIDKNEAKRFSSIYGLLGQGDQEARLNSVAGRGAQARGGFDSTGYRSAASAAAVKANTDADANAQSDLDRIFAEIQGRLPGAASQERTSQINSIGNDLQAKYGDVWGQIGAVDPNQFNRDLQWQSLVGQGDLDRMKSRFEELGTGPGFGVGAGAGGAFDAQAYRNALVGSLDTRRSQIRAEEEARKLRDAQKTIKVNGTPVGVTKAQGADIKDGWEDWKRHPLGTAPGQRVPGNVISKGADAEIKKIIPNTKDIREAAQVVLPNPVGGLKTGKKKNKYF